MSAPDVTVVIPTHDRADLVALAAESCLTGQEGVDVEVIVVDDGSTEDIEGALARLPVPSRYVRQEWTGRAAARNRGAALARAPVLAFLDSDDLSLPDRFARQLGLLDGAAGVWGQVEIIDDAGRPVPGLTQELQARIAAVGAAGATPERLAHDMRVYPSTLVLPRTVFAELGGFDEAFRVCEDIEFILRLARHGRLAFEPEPVAAIRVHAGNTPGEPMFRAHVELTAKLIRLHPGPEDRRFRARLHAEQARARWSLGETRRARGPSLAALREDPRILSDSGFLKRLAGSMLPERGVNAIRRKLRCPPPS